jgi:Protease II
MVPITITRHKNTPLDGSANLLLYGYGSYGNSMSPGFSSTRFILIDKNINLGYSTYYRWAWKEE